MTQNSPRMGRLSSCRRTKASLALTAGFAAAILVPAGPASAQRMFEAGEPFPLEALSSAASLVREDLDGDGRPDLVTCHGQEGLRILLGRMPRLFEPVRTLESEGSSVATGDFTGDGLPDLLVVGPFVVRLHVNLGGGEFAPGLEHDPPPSFGVPLPTVADVNGDGLADVVLIEQLSASRVLFGSVDGSLREGPVLAGSDDDELHVAGDFDGDGDIDLVTLGRGGLSSRRGVGDGTFEAPVASPTASEPALLASGDFFRDGIPEAVVVTLDGAVIFLSLEPDGTLLQREVADLPDLTTGIFGPQDALSAADYDGDGLLDLVLSTGDRELTGFRALLGSSDWVFPLEVDVDLGLEYRDLVFADLDDDGNQDLAISRSGAFEVVAFRGAGPGRFGIPTAVSLDSGLRDLAVVDLGSDGIGDLLAMSSTALHLAKGDRGGGYEPAVEVEFPGRAFESLAAEDLDGDGRIDLALSDQADDRLVVLSLAPDGTVSREVEHETLELPGEVRAADLDGNPDLDVVVAHRTQPALSVFLDPFSREAPPGGAPRADLALGSGQTAVVARDLDGNGTVDLVASTRTGLARLLGDGRGGFSLLPELPVLASSPCLAAGDVDGDGSVDVVGGSGTQLAVLRSAAAALPGQEPTLLEAGQRVREIELVDRDGDGRPEAVLAGTSAILVTTALVEGEFEVAERYAVGSEPRSIAVQDIDGDGRLDCAVGEYTARRLSVLRGADPAVGTAFRRGDVDSSGDAVLTDAVRVLEALFLGGAPIQCEDAADSNDSGTIDLADPVYLLRHLFLGGEAPPPPGADLCGLDRTRDELAACRLACP